MGKESGNNCNSIRKERYALKQEDEELAKEIHSKNRDFTLTWANMALWSSAIFDYLRRGVAFRAEINFNPEADIAEILIFEKITAGEKSDKSQECQE